MAAATAALATACTGTGGMKRAPTIGRSTRLLGVIARTDSRGFPMRPRGIVKEVETFLIMKD